MSDLREVAGAKEFAKRVKSILMCTDENIKEDDLYFSQTAFDYCVKYKPNYPESSNGDLVVYQNLNGSISVYGNLLSLVPTILRFNDIDDFERSLSEKHQKENT